MEKLTKNREQLLKALDELREEKSSLESDISAKQKVSKTISPNIEKKEKMLAQKELTLKQREDALYEKETALKDKQSSFKKIVVQ